MGTLQYTLVGNEDGSQNITVFMPGDAPKSAHSSHPNWDSIFEGVLSGDESVVDLFDVAQTAATKFERLTDRITVANGMLYFDGDEVHNTLAEQVVRFIQEGVEDWKPLVKFFENLMANPNAHSREALYPWIEQQKISITPDGLMVGYKGVYRTAEEGVYRAGHAGHAIVDDVPLNGEILQKVGSVVEMPRSEVMHNPRMDCDAGLHVGSYSYAKGYAEVVLEVHVNPRDVVSVPDAAWKLRTCRYQIVSDDVTAPLTAPVVPDYEPGQPKSVKPSKAKKAVSRVKEKVMGEVRVGDVYADTDKRRAGRSIKVTEINGNEATLKDENTGKVTRVSTDRLLSRKYNRVKRGRKK